MDAEMLSNFRAVGRPLQHQPETTGKPVYSNTSPHRGTAAQDPRSPQSDPPSPSHTHLDQLGDNSFEDVSVHQETSEEEEMEASSKEGRHPPPAQSRR